MHFDSGPFLWLLVIRLVELLVLLIVSYYVVKYTWLVFIKPYAPKFVKDIVNWFAK